MDPIDKIIIRIGIILLGSIFGWTAVKNADSLEQISHMGPKSSFQAGVVPLPETKK